MKEQIKKFEATFLLKADNLQYMADNLRKFAKHLEDNAEQYLECLTPTEFLLAHQEMKYYHNNISTGTLRVDGRQV